MTMMMMMKMMMMMMMTMNIRIYEHDKHDEDEDGDVMKYNCQPNRRNPYSTPWGVFLVPINGENKPLLQASPSKVNDWMIVLQEA